MPIPRRENATMAEPVRKTVSGATVSPLHEEPDDSPRPHAVPQAAPTGKRSKEQTSGAGTVRRLRRRDRVRWTLFAVLPLVLLAGGYSYVTGRHLLSTGNAYPMFAQAVFDQTRYALENDKSKLAAFQ